eukprot:9613-Heterococcus_DN1.PRE.2
MMRSSRNTSTSTRRDYSSSVTTVAAAAKACMLIRAMYSNAITAARCKSMPSFSCSSSSVQWIVQACTHHLTGG